MLRKDSFRLSGLRNRDTVVSIILVVNAFVWYSMVLSLLRANVSNSWVWFIHFSAIIISALLGALIVRRIERSRLLISWLILGTLSSMILLGANDSSLLVSSLVALSLGVSLGLGMPACMSYYTDCTDVENRGRASGITLLLSGIGMVAFGIAGAYTLTADDLLLGAVLSVWRLSSLIVFLMVKPIRTKERKNSFASYKEILTKQSFILYFVPWIMFSLVNYLGVPLLAVPDSSASDLMLIQNGFMAASAVLGGFLADAVGRKRISIAGFAMLGLGAAVRGLSADIISLYLNSVIDGIAWGFLLVLFIMTLWGDLGDNSASDKYYAIGVLPFFASRLLDLTIGPFIIDKINDTTLFSFVAFFLFLAVLPLVYAPETLPEKITQKKQIESYVEKAKRAAEEYH